MAYIFVLLITTALLTFYTIQHKKRSRSSAKEPAFTFADAEREKLDHPLEKWVYDSLKMRGFTVGAKIPFETFTADLTLPDYQIAVQCLREGDPVTQKVYEKQLQNCLHQHGWKLIRFGPRHIYRDFQKEIRKIDMLRPPR